VGTSGFGGVWIGSTIGAGSGVVSLTVLGAINLAPHRPHSSTFFVFAKRQYGQLAIDGNPYGAGDLKGVPRHAASLAQKSGIGRFPDSYTAVVQPPSSFFSSFGLTIPFAA
jgi:hypothetical protein